MPEKKSPFDFDSTDHPRFSTTPVTATTRAPIHLLARKNDINALRLLLSHSPDDVDKRDEKQLTSLHFAARYDQLDAVKLLVKAGADINRADTFDQRPLHYAAMKGDHVVAKCLLATPGIEIDAPDSELCTPLHIASLYGFHSVAGILLQAGASFSKDVFQCTPLHYAAQEGHKRTVDMLLHFTRNSTELISEADEHGNTAIHMCSDAEVMRTLINHGGQINAKNSLGEAPIHRVAAFGDVAVVRLLVEHGADIQSLTHQQNTPLHISAEHGQTEVVRFLVDFISEDQRLDFIEADDSNSCSALQRAVLGDKVETVRYLLRAGADPYALDHFDRNSVFLAAMHNSLECLEALLVESTWRSALPDEPSLAEGFDRYGNTPLHHAAEAGYLEAAKLLIRHGASIDTRNEHEETPIHFGAKSGRLNVIRHLLTHEPSLMTSVDEDGNTPLHLAAANGHDLVVQDLIAQGADVTALNSDQWTPLHFAAKEGHRLICSMLLARDPTLLFMADKHGQQPLHLAAAAGHLDTVTTLIAAGAAIDSTDVSGRNSLDVAIEEMHRHVVKAMIDTDDWSDALWNRKIQCSEKYFTTFRRLLKHMPDMACLVLNRCISVEHTPDDLRYAITFDFRLIEDDFSAQRPKATKQSWIAQHKPLGSVQTRLLATPRKLFQKAPRPNPYHVLSLIVETSNESLLSHPLVIALLRYKWSRYGQPVYYTLLVFYLTFVISLTTFVLSSAQPHFLHSDSPQPISKQSCVLNVFGKSFRSKSILATFVCCSTVLNLAGEAWQLWRRGLYYITFRNAIELFMYGGTLVLVVPPMIFPDCGIFFEGWSLGALAVSFAWIDLALKLQRFQLFGIYIIMFVNVLRTFSQFVIVFVVFLTGFAVAFYMLLQDREPFQHSQSSLLRTLIMAMGEFEMDNLIFAEDNPVIYPVATRIVLLLFAILITIIIMNLMVGLAVDDIKAVQEKARLKKLAMQVDLVLELEDFIPLRFFRRREQLTIYPKDQDKDSIMCRILRKKMGYSPTLCTQNIVDQVENISHTLKISDEHKAEKEAVLNRILDAQQELGQNLAQSVAHMQNVINEFVAGGGGQNGESS